MKKTLSASNCIAIVVIALFSVSQFNNQGLIKPKDEFSLVVDNRNQSFAGPIHVRIPLNDKTLDWSPDVRRLWLEKSPSSRPSAPAKLLLTTVGWNQPNQTTGLKFPRSKRVRGLVQGVINHPWFDPTAWEDILSNKATPDPSIRYYVFLDVDTCFESNWPKYGSGYKANCDTKFNRSNSRTTCSRLHFCQYIHGAVKTRLFRSGVNATLVVFECGGSGPAAQYMRNIDKEKIPMAFVTLSSSPNKMRDPPDQGLPPPAGKTAHLTQQQIKDIETCNEDSRPLLLSFVGNFRHTARQELFKIHNGKDVLVFPGGTGKKPSIPHYFDGTYEELLASSKFAAAPRGDNRFSYRFTEALSAGAIPVVHADGWVLPFRKELVDWSECAVVLPEVTANKTLEYLAKITSDERCKMRKRCYEIYQNHISSDEAIVAGIIEGLERVVKSKEGYWFSPDYYDAPD